MIIHVILVAALVLGAALALRLTGRSSVERLTMALLPLAVTVAAGLVAAEFLQSFFRGWNDARLAPAAAWLEGYRLYYGVNEGPLLGLMYPPLAALAYLPALCGRTPEQAVALGELLTMLYFFAPPLAVLAIESRRVAAPWPASGLCLAAFVLFSGAVRALSGPAFWIHADAPALGLSAAAVAIVYFSDASRHSATLIAAALAAVLSILSKQVALPIVVAVPLVCLIHDGRRAASRCVLWLLVVGGVCAVLVAALSDLDALVLNALVLPARHPWTGPTLPTLATAGWELLLVSAGPLALLVLCGVAARSSEAQRSETFLDWLRGRRWTMWPLVGLLMMPTALLGRVKVGGDANALGFSLYFLAIGVGLALLREISIRLSTARTPPTWPAKLPAFGLTIAVVALCLLAYPQVRAIPDLVKLFPDNPERTGFAFARAHPDAVYFPSNPLITLYSERKAHHLSDGAYSRRLADIEIAPRHIDEFLPSRIELVAYTGQFDMCQAYLPQFTRRVQVDGLPPYWTVLAREPSPPAD